MSAHPLRRAIAFGAALTAVGALVAGPAADAAGAAGNSSAAIYHDPDPGQVTRYIADNANTPYLGWSSWSLQATHAPGVNTQGDYSYLTEANVLKQTEPSRRS